MERLQEILSYSEAGPALEARRLSVALDTSQELLPMTTDWTQFRGLSFVVHAAEAAALQERGEALSADTYIRSLYQDQEARDIYGRWLREVLSIAHRLKNAEKNISLL